MEDEQSVFIHSVTSKNEFARKETSAFSNQKKVETTLFSKQACKNRLADAMLLYKGKS